MTDDYERLSRLHEVATERTVQLAAVIEEALGEARASSIPLGMSEAGFYRGMLRRVESTLASADAAAVLRERDAEKWDEGYNDGFGDGGINAWDPLNPYREGS